MIIKPNHNEVNLNGLVSTSYINSWNTHSNLLDLISSLCSIFSLDPPLFSKTVFNSQQIQQQQQQQEQTSQQSQQQQYKTQTATYENKSSANNYSPIPVNSIYQNGNANNQFKNVNSRESLINSVTQKLKNAIASELDKLSGNNSIAISLLIIFFIYFFYCHFFT